MWSNQYKVCSSTSLRFVVIEDSWDIVSFCIFPVSVIQPVMSTYPNSLLPSCSIAKMEFILFHTWDESRWPMSLGPPSLFRSNAYHCGDSSFETPFYNTRCRVSCWQCGCRMASGTDSHSSTSTASFRRCFPGRDYPYDQRSVASARRRFWPFGWKRWPAVIDIQETESI